MGCYNGHERTAVWYRDFSRYHELEYFNSPLEYFKGPPCSWVCGAANLDTRLAGTGQPRGYREPREKYPSMAFRPGVIFQSFAMPYDKGGARYFVVNMKELNTALILCRRGTNFSYQGTQYCTGRSESGGNTVLIRCSRGTNLNTGTKELITKQQGTNI